MFKIGDFSRLTFVSVRMLRYYDETGLLKPASVDTLTGYRYYSALQINTISRIVALRDMGFNVAEIARVLADPGKETQRELMEEKMREIETQINTSETILNHLRSAIKNLDKECTAMNFNATIKSVPEYLVLSVRDIIPNYASEGLLWERICQVEASKFAKTGGACFAIYHDEGFKEADVDVEVVVEVDHAFENGKDYTCRKTEAVETMVSVLVPGDFSLITDGFAFAGQWIEQNGYQLAGKSRQATLRGPWNETDPANYLTEVQIPIKKD